MGVLPQPSDPRRLAALVGPGRAKDLLLAASKWDAEHAFSVGFLDWIDADVIARAHALAEPALAASQMRVREIKALISR